MRTTIAPIALGALLFAAPAVALTIDNFEAGNFTVVDVAPGPTHGQQTGLSPDVIGGVRLVRSNATAGGTTTNSLTTTAGPDGAQVSFADAEAPFGSGDAAFIYDGIADGSNNSNTGVLNVDLTPFFSIDVEAVATPGSVSLQLTLWDVDGGQNSALVPIANGTNAFLLSSFGLIDLSLVKSIRLAIFAIDPGESLEISEISANPVPEPGTALLLALGLAGMALRKRTAH